MGETLYENLNSPWGAWARAQGLVVVLNGDLQDNGAGQITLPSMRIISPLSGTYIDVNAGAFTLGLRDALVVDLPPSTAERAAVNARQVTWVDATRNYDNRDSLVLGVRAQTSGLWQWRMGAGGGARTIRRRIDLRNPATVSAGNSFPQLVALTAWDFWHWEFVKDVDAHVGGIVEVPSNVDSVPSPKIILALAANATTGVTRMQAQVKRIADAGLINFAAFDVTVALDVSMPGTAYTCKMATLDISSLVPVAGEFLAVRISHLGAHANDTLAVNTLLASAWLEVKEKF